MLQEVYVGLQLKDKMLAFGEREIKECYNAEGLVKMMDLIFLRIHQNEFL